MRRLHQRCVGCEIQGRPGRSGRPSLLHQRSGNRHRRERLVGAAAAIERAGVQRMLHGVVRSTAAEVPAAASALVRTPVHGAVRSEVHEALRRSARTSGGTGAPGGAPRGGRAGGGRCPAPATRVVRRRRAEARPVAGAAGEGRARRALRRARRAAPARGGRGGAVDDTVEPCRGRGGPATAGSAASRRPSGSAECAKRTEASGIAVEIARSAIGAESPAAKRDAQIR